MSTSPNAHRSLFPLRPVPYERMMLHDDRPDYPMVCPAEFTFEGRFDRPRFESALAQTLLRHPMLQTTIEHRRGHPHRWIWSPLEPEVHWIGDAEPLDYARANYLDVGQQIGMRLWVQERNNRTRLLFEMHHACTDAAGGMLFVEDLLTLYAASFPHQSGRRPTLRKLDPNLLLRRGHFEGASGLTLRRVYNDLRDMGEVCRFFGCRPRPMAAGPTGPRLLPDHAAVPERVVNQTFSYEFLRQLRQAATASSCSMNDLLVHALLCCLGEWNQTHGDPRGDDWLRVVIPTNLRTRADLELPAANRLSNVFITRRQSSLAHREQLLRSITAETTQNRRDRLAYNMLSKLGIMDAAPFALPALFSPRRCLATAVLSNIGDPTRRFAFRFPRDRGRIVAGDVVLDNINAVPPIRPLTRLVMLINTYGGNLSVSIQLDPKYFGASDSSQFLNRFESMLEQSIPSDSRRRAAA